MSIFTPRTVAPSLGLLVLLSLGRVAHAQAPMGGGMGGMGGMGGGGMPQGPGQGGKPDKKEGPAEAAPKDKQALQPIEPVPAQPRGLRQLQLFEMHGYMRMRADYFHRLDLGMGKSNGQSVGTTYAEGGTNDGKFFPPPHVANETIDGVAAPNDAGGNAANCFGDLTAKGVNITKAGRRCGRHNGFGSANMRLRMEPTLHITDTIKVHATIDALDNLVLGSTPDSYLGDSPFAPLDVFTRTQLPPTAGQNSFNDSLTVKRAYGHIRFGWGLDIKFGRMPHHWGMGLVANDGNGYYRGDKSDIVRQLDMDYGDSVDSMRLGFDFGKDRRNVHTLELAWDWASSGPTTAQLLGSSWNSGNRIGQDFSAERFDNVYQWRVSILRRDDPAMLQRKISLGRPVVNYGAIAWLRSQAVDRVTGSPGLGDGLGTNPSWSDGDQVDDGLGRPGASLGNGDLDEFGDSGIQNYANLLIRRRALILTPDLWLRVNWKTLRVEFEASGVVGRFNERNLDPDNGDTRFDYAAVNSGDLLRRTFLQVGYALEFKYGLFKDRFHLGLDHGFASGDSSEANRYNPQSPLIVNGQDSRWTNFRFNPAYMQDLLLFRELLGTASNAAYFKPWMAFYFFDNNFSGRLDIEYAIAHQRAATIGNKNNYGLEIDAALRYHDQQEPIFVQLQYGVMFPFGGFNRDPAIYPYAQNGGDAKAAQTIQAQIGIKF